MEKPHSFKEMIEGLISDSLSGNAVVFDDGASKKILSYDDLTKKIKAIVSEIAEYLCQGDYVGVQARNSLDTICIMLSLLKIKAVFCPINLEESLSNNLNRLFKSIGIKFLFVSRKHLDANSNLKDLLKNKQLVIHQIRCLNDMVILDFSSKESVLPLNRHGIELVVTSSGSTGLQKVIKVTGKCILPNIVDLYKIFKVTSNDVIFMSSPLTFDASIVQIFVSLMARATLLIVSDKMKKQPGNLCNILFERNRTTILQATPSLVQQLGGSLLQQSSDFTHTSVRVLCLGAEPFPSRSEMKKLVGDSNKLELFNIYGISEVSSWASIEKVDLSGKEDLSATDWITTGYPNRQICDLETAANWRVSIGAPLSGTEMEIRGEDGSVLQEGYGEIWIGGKDRVCLIDGETDIVHHTMRSSGDIGLLANNKLYYIQRKDNRVKILGKFVDLEQIENVAEEIFAVTSSVCVYARKEDKGVGHVVLFLAIQDGFSEKDVERDVLRKLSSRLPANHLFFRFAFLKASPLSSHGKKDRIKLQKLASDGFSEGRFDKLANFDDILVSLFENAIHRNSGSLESYDIKKNFVENGGDSFAAVFLENQICDYMKCLSIETGSLSFLYDKIVSKSYKEVNEYLKEKLRKDDYQGQLRLHIGDVEKQHDREYIEWEFDSQEREEHCFVNKEQLEEDVFNTGKFERKEFERQVECVSVNGKLKSQQDRKILTEEVEIQEDKFYKSPDIELPRYEKETSKKDPFLKRESLALGHADSLKFQDETRLNKTRKRGLDQVEQKPVKKKRPLGGRSPSNQKDYVNEDANSRDNCDNSPLKNTTFVSKMEYLEGRYENDTVYSTIVDNSLSCNDIPQKSTDSNATNKCRKDDFSCSTNEACYCSISRGSNYSICDYCFARGSRIACLSIKATVSVKSLSSIERHWLFDTSKCVDASPLVVCSGNHLSSIVYIGSHSHYFYSINGDDGNLIWRVKLGDRIESSAAISKDGTKVIVGCYDHFVYIISRRDGSIAWQLKTGDSVKCSPIVSKLNGFVFVGSHDNYMYAIDTKRQIQVWRTYGEGGSIFSSPAISEDCKILFVGTLGGKLLAFDSSTGELLWRFNAKKPIFASPVCVNRSVCFCCVDGYVYVVTNSGSLCWSFKTSGPIFSSPCVGLSLTSYHIVVGCHDKSTYCLSSAGTLVWRKQLDSAIYSTPTVITHRMNHSREACIEDEYNAKDLVVACTTNGTLYVLNFANGKMVRSFTFPNEVFSSPVIFKETVVVGCRDNSVYCLTL